MSRRKKCIFCRVFCMYRKITDSYNDICSKGKNRRYRNDKENINHRRRRLYRKSHSAELQKAYVVQNTAKMNADQSSAKIQSFKQQFDNLRNEAAKLDTQINEIMDNQESINIELDTSESLENDLNINIEKEQKELEEIHAKESFKTRKSEQIHLEYAGLEQKYTFITENIIRMTFPICTTTWSPDLI